MMKNEATLKDIECSIVIQHMQADIKGEQLKREIQELRLHPNKKRLINKKLREIKDLYDYKFALDRTLQLIT